MLQAIRLALAIGVLWMPVRPGVWQFETQMSTEGALAPVRAVVVRLDPTVVRFALDTATFDLGSRGAWTVDRIPEGGLLALNAGQFTAAGIWGWLVRDGVESNPPGTGTLAMAFAVDSAGVPSLLAPAELPSARGHVRLAFQSYPALLAGDGALPWELRAPGRGVDLDHRDSRLAVGLLPDGTIVVALTRFTGMGGGAETLPWGPTVGEMSAFMKSLGCRRAMLLDGGLSSQMALRLANGALKRWTNWRKVPLGLVVTPGAISPANAPSNSRRVAPRPR